MYGSEMTDYDVLDTSFAVSRIWLFTSATILSTMGPIDAMNVIKYQNMLTTSSVKNDGRSCVNHSIYHVNRTRSTKVYRLEKEKNKKPSCC